MSLPIRATGAAGEVTILEPITPQAVHAVTAAQLKCDSQTALDMRYATTPQAKTLGKESRRVPEDRQGSARDRGWYGEGLMGPRAPRTGCV